LCVGCSRGIGAATAREIAKNGGQVYICARNETLVNKLIEENSDKIFGSVCDASNKTVYDSLVKMAITKMGGITGLVYVPLYYFTDRTLFEDMDIENIIFYMNQQFEYSVQGFLRAVKASLNSLEQSNIGSVVSLSSVASQIFFPDVGNQHYGAAKAALEYYTKSLAYEFAPKNIRFNILRLGVIRTTAWRTVAPDLSEEEMNTMLETVDSSHALLRIGESEEVAKTILFLLSPKSSFITGDVINVDGGVLLTGRLQSFSFETSPSQPFIPNPNFVNPVRQKLNQRKNQSKCNATQA